MVVLILFICRAVQVDSVITPSLAPQVSCRSVVLAVVVIRAGVVLLAPLIRHPNFHEFDLTAPCQAGRNLLSRHWFAQQL